MTPQQAWAAGQTVQCRFAWDHLWVDLPSDIEPDWAPPMQYRVKPVERRPFDYDALPEAPF